MAKKMLSVDFSNFSNYAEKLEKLGADLQDIFGKVMQEAAEEVQNETRAALADGNLPAHGKYSQGDTMNSVIDDTSVTWHGYVGEVSLGFDKTKKGSGGFLITGTPKMKPDYKLQEIYQTKKYESKIKKEIEETLQDEINSRLS